MLLFGHSALIEHELYRVPFRSYLRTMARIITRTDAVKLCSGPAKLEWMSWPTGSKHPDLRDCFSRIQLMLFWSSLASIGMNLEAWAKALTTKVVSQREPWLVPSLDGPQTWIKRFINATIVMDKLWWMLPVLLNVIIARCTKYSSRVKRFLETKAIKVEPTNSEKRNSGSITLRLVFFWQVLEMRWINCILTHLQSTFQNQGVIRIAILPLLKVRGFSSLSMRFRFSFP